MCGISGITGPECPANLISRMVKALHHRGPDTSDTYTAPTRDCALGFNRLKIIDLSEAGSQPMRSASGRYVIVFNGEIYNYVELREKIGAYPYKSKTDSEVILAAWEKWGKDCLQHFIGMFAFAIWDEEKRSLFCARDRLGIKPFYYTQQDGILYFASEIKALLAAGIEPRPDWQSWSVFLAHGVYDHDERSFFENISALPAGHWLEFGNGKLKTGSYWDLASIAKDTLDIPLDQAAKQFHDLMMDSVRLRLRSDVPLGVNLSGGLDSSSLMAFVDAQPSAAKELNCFTYAFDNLQYDETGFADSVPAKKSWKRHVARLSPDTMWNDLDAMMLHQEAPYGGTGTLAYFNMHREVKKRGITVLLEGQGVDELLAGYAYYQAPPSHEPRYQDGTSFLKNVCLSEDVAAIAPDAPGFDQPFKSNLKNQLYRDLRHTKLPRVLRMNDRLSMAFSLELREPFLDHRVVELCFRLPDEHKLKDGKTKILLREAMKTTLPNNVRLAQKRAVVTPQREWIRGPLKDRIGDIIGSREFREYGVFDVSEVRKAFESFCAGEGDNAFFIWQWINLDSWFKVFKTAPDAMAGQNAA